MSASWAAGPEAEELVPPTLNKLRPDRPGGEQKPTYQEPRFIAESHATFMQEFQFQPANLDGVSVLSVERMIEALRVAGVDRTQFESGSVPKEAINQALRTLHDYYQLETKDLASKEMWKEFNRVAKYSRNPNWRGYYGDFYQNSVHNMFREAMAEGIQPVEMLKSKPYEVMELNPETGKVDRFLRWEFKNPADPENPLKADLHMPNDDKLMQFRPSELANAAKESAKSLPAEAAMFYIANNIMALGTQFIDPMSNPQGIQNMLGMYFDKKTVLNFEELFHFYTFILGSRISTRAMEIGLKRVGVNYAGQMLARPFMNYMGLAAGSLMSSFIADGWTSAKNCYLGYFDNPDNFKDQAEAEFARQSCDIAYERWIRGKMAYKYMGDAMTLMMAAGASAIAGKAISQGWRGAKIATAALANKTKHAALKYVASRGGTIAGRVVITGLKVSRVIGVGSAAIPSVPTQIVGWGLRIGSFVMFLYWHKIVNALVVKPYKSWDLSGEADDSEERLLKDFDAFRNNGWKIESDKPIDKCGNLLQRAAANQKAMKRLIETGQGLKCYDGTILETLDEYADDQKDWRDMMIEEVNAAYANWTKHTMKLVDKYTGTYLFYQDFVERVRKKSSVLFSDKNPYAGLNGIVSNHHDDQYIADDGSRTMEEMRSAQELNVRMQATSVGVWLKYLQGEHGPAAIRQFSRPKDNEDGAQWGQRMEAERNSIIGHLDFIHKGLLSKDIKDIKKAINHAWDLDKHYRDYCIKQHEGGIRSVSDQLKQELSLDEDAVKKTIAEGTAAEQDAAKSLLQEYIYKLQERSENLRTPPFCYFSEIRRRFGSQKPGSQVYSKTYLEEVSALIVGQKIDPELFPKRVEHVETPNIATSLLASMACGLDLNSRQPWYKRILPGVKADKSDRGWKVVWGERPKSSVKDAFGFEMDFTPPRLIPPDEDDNRLCWDQSYHSAPEVYIPMPVDPYAHWVKYNGKEYSRMIDMVIENLYPELFDDWSGEGSGFEYWWSNYVGRDFNYVLDSADTSYRKMLREEFLPAIYGYKKNLNTKLGLKDCSYAHAYVQDYLSEGMDLTYSDQLPRGRATCTRRGISKRGNQRVLRKSPQILAGD